MSSLAARTSPREWRPGIRLIPGIGVGVRSRSRPDREHIVQLCRTHDGRTTATCTCESWRYRCRRTGNLCRHQREARVWAAARLAALNAIRTAAFAGSCLAAAA